MRLPRTNFSNSFNNLDEEGEPGLDRFPEGEELLRRMIDEQRRANTGVNADEIAASQIEGRGLPGWQNAFSLAPNVRFSRTPESALARKAESAPAAPIQDNLPAAPALQTTAVVQPVVQPPVNKRSAEPKIAQPEVIPQPPHATGARALSYKLRRELARQEAAAALAAEAAANAVTTEIALEEPVSIAPTEQQFSPMVTAVSDPVLPEVAALPAEAETGTMPVDVPPARPVAAPLRAPSFVDYLSDQVFWEVMDSFAARQTASRPAMIAPTAMLAVTTEPAAEAPAPVQHAVTLPVLTPSVAHRPPFNPQDGSVAALYREIACRSVSLTEQASPPEADVQPDILATETRAEPEPVQAEIVPEPAPPPPPARAAAPPAVPSPIAPAILPPAASILPVSRGVIDGDYEFPPIDLLQQPPLRETETMTPEVLEQSAGLLETVLEDFGIKGEIIDVRPGPVVTLYEFEPAPGVKSSRVIGLSDDIARSMSALSARVAVIPGRNVIGIELPNPVRETVYFRELIETPDYTASHFRLALGLGKTIGGEPVIAELAKMPHLLVAGTTGSGKSVAINTMILSLLYRLKPEECRLIMVDPKMLELSVYDGIPHLLTPVVTDPKKAVMALKWAVREMEDRYKKMSRLGVRNIDGFNARAAAARAKNETVLVSVQKGFDRATGEAVFEQEEMDLAAMPYIVVIIDEMADLMMVAGKEIEGAVQRLAQMARAAGIHLIMATQRPSVDVITGTIKANFPTRISFQVTSKIDSRTILGEPGAEQLLGQGDMLHMMGGGRVTRVHGPFVSDDEVEKVVRHLKTQGQPEYLGTVTEEAEDEPEEADDDVPVADRGSVAVADDDGDDLYEKAVKVVLRDKKCSTSYIQRRMSVGYNRAASLVERMEKEGLVGPANHVGKRAIIGTARDTSEAPPAET